MRHMLCGRCKCGDVLQEVRPSETISVKQTQLDDVLDRLNAALKGYVTALDLEGQGQLMPRSKQLPANALATVKVLQVAAGGAKPKVLVTLPSGGGRVQAPGLSSISTKAVLAGRARCWRRSAKATIPTCFGVCSTSTLFSNLHQTLLRPTTYL